RWHSFPKPRCDYRFHPSRRWRFDFAWPYHGVAAEIEDGACWAGGKQGQGQGCQADCEKLNAAVMAGWRLLRFTADQVGSGYAIAALAQLLEE
ncbi:MAG: hypothetical protein M3014_03990, partial [Chloroflexota bacterium]|nr:hypothetical protein [Chloroflexota bacterium]